MPKPEPTPLTLEQQFALRAFADQVDRMSHDQARKCLVVLYADLLTREAAYRAMLGQQWFSGL